MSKPDCMVSDYLVVGSGIGGLFLALKLGDCGTVRIVTKKDRAESNTNYAQGGIACVVGADDSYEDHIRDTMEVGDGLCREDVVRAIVEEGPSRVRELIALGIEFDASNHRLGEFDLGREGGHSRRRVLHTGDFTGRQIEAALLTAVDRHPNIHLHEDHIAVDLVIDPPGNGDPNRACRGAYALDRHRGDVVTFLAGSTALATGGMGKVYLYTSNPGIATGDGVAMAFRAGASVANMEFVQFHPTCLYHPAAGNFLVSEAVRGEGGLLRNAAGDTFMDEVHPMGSLAPRDVVARAIDEQMKRRGDPCVYLDITHQSEDFIRGRFPNIYSQCMRYGIDMARDLIPVVPAAHYCCGGIATDIDGKTTIPGLWAVGEVAHTGLHGANRLASNSLLEAIVLAHRAGRPMCASAGARPADAAVRPWSYGGRRESREQVIVEHNWNTIRQLMWNYVGIVRADRRLARAQKRLAVACEEIRQYAQESRITSDLVELRNIATIAALIIESASRRKESRGLHFTLDYPERDDARFQHDTVVRPGEIRDLP
jgi:L-aspartate oxidase